MGVIVSGKILCFGVILFLATAQIAGEPEKEHDSKSKDKTDKVRKLLEDLFLVSLDSVSIADVKAPEMWNFEDDSEM